MEISTSNSFTASLSDAGVGQLMHLPTCSSLVRISCLKPKFHSVECVQQEKNMGGIVLHVCMHHRAPNICPSKISICMSFQAATRFCFWSMRLSPAEQQNHESRTTLLADDLPVWGFIGEKETEIVHGAEQNVYYLFTHYIFSITHNGDQVCGQS